MPISYDLIHLIHPIGGDRIFRIAPPLLLSILVVLAIQGIIRLFHFDQIDTLYGTARFKFSYGFREALYALFSFGFAGDLTGGINGPLWSLAIEIQLYFLVIFVMWLKQRQNTILACFILGIALYRMTQDPNVLLGYGTFGLGYLMYRFSLISNFSIRYVKFARYTGYIIFNVAILWMMYMFYQDAKYLDVLAEWNSIFSQLIFAVGFALCFLGRINLSSRFLMAMGHVSYSIYILHFPILLFFSYLLYGYTSLMSRSIIAWLICFLGCAFSIFIAYRVGIWVERPATQKKMVFFFTPTR